MTREEFFKFIDTKIISYPNEGLLYISDIEDEIYNLFDSFEAELKAKDEEIAKHKHIIEWIEENSNASLCDYYNSLPNAEE